MTSILDIATQIRPLVPVERLQQCCSLFQNRIGPEQLRELDRESLLNIEHANGPESIVYWLEFKLRSQDRP